MMSAQASVYIFLIVFVAMAAWMGWASNWLMLRLLVGKLPIKGFEFGVLGYNSEAVARGLVGRVASLASLSEVMRTMEPEKISQQLNEAVVARLDDYVDDIMSEKYSVMWGNMPQMIKSRVHRRMRRQLPVILDNLLDDIAEHLDDLIDKREFVVNKLIADPEFIQQWIKQTLVQEQQFLCTLGMWIGAGIGLFQALIWYFIPAVDLLPIAAVFLVFIAVTIPYYVLINGGIRSYLPISTRFDQSNLIQSSANLLTYQLMTLQDLLASLFQGEAARRTQSMVQRHIRPLLDSAVARTSLQLTLGMEGYAYIKQHIVERAIELTVQNLSHIHLRDGQQVRIHQLFWMRLSSLPREAWSDILNRVLGKWYWGRFWVVLILAFGVGLVQAWLWHHLPH